MLQSLLPKSPINASSSSSDAAPTITMGPSKRSLPSSSPTTSDDPPAGKKPHHSPPAAIAVTSVTHDSLEQESRGLRLLSLLLHCAESVAIDNLSEALTLLPEISELASPFGSSPERVAAYFADALHARILSSFLGAYSPLSFKPLILTQTHRISRAFQLLNSISPLLKFSHFTSNQAIFQALESRDRVHIVDLDIMQGLQWPGLFHILSSRPRPIQSIRITGVGPAIENLQSTGRRLADFAAGFGLPFDFTPIEGKIGDLTDLSHFCPRDPDEAIVVHWTQHCLYDVTGSDIAAAQILKSIRPLLVTVVEQDLGHGGDFLARFVEALHYYSALFDAIGDGGAEGEERWEVERGILGGEIRNILAVGGPKRTGEVRIERWGDELRRVGFRPVSLSGSPAAQASLLLGMVPWKGYTLVDEEGRLKLGWKDLSLLTASAWRPAYGNGGAGESEGGDWDTNDRVSL
ncbi:Scarecrow-like protein 23 [Platanthera guangdongensis]|uniref:Scarecrow-like protein 23 n=1 Tax=Platanthera guangdongensis TaxID=2320717 RepID=A0ABR2MX13_9ASPA